ncbi:hypothetical protein HRbin40_01099 [bacterium HR40]|nr:hypothetical protein HRbin40_01099 [bacterium HR40]
MLSRSEIQRALWGAWLVGVRDPRALEWFEFTVEGFWRSFFAALLAAPFYLFLALHEYAIAGAPADPFWTAFVRAVTYALDWALFPIAVFLLVRLVDLGHRYVVYIVVNNWATVLQLFAFSLAVAVARLLPEALASLVLVATLALVLAYRWLVAREALATSGWMASAFVLVDLVLGLLLDRLARSLL